MGTKLKELKDVFIKILIITGIFIHLSVFVLPFYDDSAGIGVLLSTIHRIPAGLMYFLHFPTGVIFYYLSSIIFGISDFSIRLVPIVFNFLSICLIYKTSYEFFNKKTAMIALFLSFFTFFPYFMSTLAEFDGAMMAFFSLLSFYSLHSFLKSNNKILFLIFLISSGILVSLKLKSLIMIVPMMITIVLYTKDVKKTLRYGIYLALSIGFLYFLNLLVMYIIEKSYFYNFIGSLMSHNVKSSSLFTNVIVKILGLANNQMTASVGQAAANKTIDFTKYFGLIIYLTPLYIMTIAHQLFTNLKRNFAFLIWIIVPAIFFFVGSPLGVLTAPRYSTIFFPFILILTSNTIFEFTKDKEYSKYYLNRPLILLVWTSILTFLLYFISNTLKNYNYLHQGVGPVIKFSPLALFIYFDIAIFAFVLFLCFRKRRFSSVFYTVFLLVSLSINIYLISEPVINNTHRMFISEIKEYSRNGLPNNIIYTWNEDAAYYADTEMIPLLSMSAPIGNLLVNKTKEYKTMLFYDLEHDFESDKKIIKENGGTAILLNYPITYFNSDYYREVAGFFDVNCRMKKELITEEGFLRIYEC